VSVAKVEVSRDVAGLGFEVEEVEVGCGEYVKTGLV